MSLRIVRLGTPRAKGEGLRIGTVRRPPRGVPKERFAAEDWYDVWYPVLSPTPDLMHQAQAAQKTGDAKDWAAFVRAFKAEMAEPAPSRTLDLLSALSKSASFSIGCYCAEEARCHRTVLRELLTERGAEIA
jgi:uncharacterized protein YeaO (DUF488 family)